MNHERPQRIALGAFVNYRTNSSLFEKGELGAVLTERIDPTAKTHSPADRVGFLKRPYVRAARQAVFVRLEWMEIRPRKTSNGGNS